MRFEYKGTFPQPPEMGLKARIGWEYFFAKNHPDWACVHTHDGMWIVCDDDCDLDKATIHTSDEEFIGWLEEIADEYLREKPVEFLSRFVTVEGLLTKKVAQAMLETIEDDRKAREN